MSDTEKKSNETTQARSPFLALEEARALIKEITTFFPVITIDRDFVTMEVRGLTIQGSLGSAESLVKDARKLPDILKELWVRSEVEKAILDYLFVYVIYIIRDDSNNIIDFYSVGDSSEWTANGVATYLKVSKASITRALEVLLEKELIEIEYTDSPYEHDDAVGVDASALWGIVERVAKQRSEG